MTAILVVNKSTVVSDDDVRHMTRAVAKQVRHHAAPVWGLMPIPVMFSSTATDAAPGTWVIAVLDDSDQAGALGWHTEDQGDLIYGRVFAKPVLDNGGDALTAQLSVASVLSHEVLETMADPHVNGWYDNGQGTLVAAEVGDPVENDSYLIGLAGSTNQVTVSNFVTPAWFDPLASTDSQFDWMGNVHAPFTMSPGGYWVEMSAGKVSQRFGETYPEWRKASKLADTSRTARRVPHEVDLGGSVISLASGSS